ncbi:MAG TPA: type II toxin-antitoxin system VapC family toxin [Steroidobacteraceae bacterium]
MDAESVKAYPAAVAWESFGVAETPAEYVFHRPRLYLETTIPSFLTERPSRDMGTARMQGITARWWNSWRTQFEIFTSSAVRDEAAVGDREAAQRRLHFLKGVRTLEPTPHSDALAAELLARSGLPPSADKDAMHIAIAAAHRMKFLLSWNCAHLVNPQTAPRIAAICQHEGYSPPVLCTPEQLLTRYEHGHAF